MILHTLSASPNASSALQDCLRLATAGDTVLCLDDSVYALRSTEANRRHLSSAPGLLFKVLASDLAARGLDTESLLPEVQVCENTALLSLSETASKVIHWG